ncbi:hypothetical protein F5Y08DRAFT_336182 [Xylaria arbuscula]|nr:hypothetical protein F5Y08DRAFT_336182 [Xylaria arbuscula]
MLQEPESNPLVTALQPKSTSQDEVKTSPPENDSKPKYSAVALIILPLALGVAFVIGHHLYNSYLDGKQLNQVGLSQTLIIRIGTAFAFLSKTALAAASFTEVKSRSPPQFSYNATQWTDVNEPGRYGSLLIFFGASSDVQRVGFAAAATGSIIPLAYQNLNETYEMEFNGPAIRCSTANDTLRQAVGDNVYASATSADGQPSYWSWAGADDHGITQPLSLDDLYNQHTHLDSSGTWPSWPYSWDYNDKESARMFVFSSLRSLSQGKRDLGNVTECILHNTSYSVTINVTNGVTSFTTTKLIFHEGIPALSSHDIYGNKSLAHDFTIFSYQAIMDTFNKLLVGYSRDLNGVIHATYSSFERTDIDWTTLEGTQRDLEILFQNMTLSMFSAPSLLLNSSSASPQIPVTVTTYPLTYDYDAKDLWTAYGISTAIALIATIFGAKSVIMNNASFSLKFSTGMRIVKISGLYHLLDDKDDGSGDVPRELARTKLRLNDHGSSLSEEEQS